MGRSGALGPLASPALMGAQTSVSPERAQELIADGGQLVDVRDDHEHEGGHIPGDRHIRFDRLKDEAGSLDAGKPLVVYCRSGDRSGAAADALRASGFDAYSVDGGATAWSQHGLPFEGEIVERDAFPPA
jgi:rhodanese-related sulfurtransferase